MRMDKRRCTARRERNGIGIGKKSRIDTQVCIANIIT